jgi:hypothetical protein
MHVANNVYYERADFQCEIPYTSTPEQWEILEVQNFSALSTTPRYAPFLIFAKDKILNIHIENLHMV